MVPRTAALRCLRGRGHRAAVGMDAVAITGLSGDGKIRRGDAGKAQPGARPLRWNLTPPDPKSDALNGPFHLHVITAVCICMKSSLLGPLSPGGRGTG